MPHTITVGSRSLLVTATAWLVIGLAVLTLGSTLLPALGLAWPQVLQPLALRLQPLAAQAPWLLLGGAAVAAALLACAVGLLRRLEWARRLAIGVLALAALSQLGGLWLQHQVVSGLLDLTLSSQPVPDLAAGVLGALARTTQALGWLLSLAAGALMLWLMWRLISGRERQEFA